MGNYKDLEVYKNQRQSSFWFCPFPKGSPKGRIKIGKFPSLFIFLFIILLLVNVGCDDKDPCCPAIQKLQLLEASADGQDLFKVTSFSQSPQKLKFLFSHPLKNDAATHIGIKEISTGSVLQFNHTFYDSERGIEVIPTSAFANNKSYEITLSTGITGIASNEYAGNKFTITMAKGFLTIDSFVVNRIAYKANDTVRNLGQGPTILLQLSQDISSSVIQSNTTITSISGSSIKFEIKKLAPKKYNIQLTETLSAFNYFKMTFNAGIGSESGNEFNPASYTLYSNPELLSDNALMDLVQKQSFKYFWDFGHPVSGLARERNVSGETVTIGGSGFGIMAMIVAAERGFITRSAAIERWETMISFLKSADRFYGVWPH
jgi:hypothetical protein